MSYFAKLNKILDVGYLPISIARYTPKGINNIPQLKIFAPSEELLRKIKSGEIDETEYEKIIIDKKRNQIFLQVKFLTHSLRKIRCWN